MWDQMKTWSPILVSFLDNKAKKQKFCNKDGSKDLYYFQSEQMIAKIRNLLQDIPQKWTQFFFTLPRLREHSSKCWDQAKNYVVSWSIPQGLCTSLP